MPDRQTATKAGGGQNKEEHEHPRSHRPMARCSGFTVPQLLGRRGSGSALLQFPSRFSRTGWKRSRTSGLLMARGCHLVLGQSKIKGDVPELHRHTGAKGISAADSRYFMPLVDPRSTSS